MCKKITVFCDATTCHPVDKTHHLENLKLLTQKFRVSKQKACTTYEVSVLSVSLIDFFLFDLYIILRLTEIAAAVYVDIFHALFGVVLSRLLLRQLIVLLLLRQLIVLLYRLLMTGD